MTRLPGDEITFYVPARNAGETLGACLRAIANQTLKPAEILIVVDTTSDDNTLEVARGFGGARILEHEGRKLGWVRNLAIAEASTDWIACSDADVIIHEDWLERLSAHAHSPAVVIGGCVEERIRSPFDHWRAINCPHHWGDVPFRNPYMLVGNALYDRRALLSIGGYQNHLGPYDDSDLCLRLRDAGFDLAYEPTALAWHHRMDSLRSILELRWNYGRFRQTEAFDRLTGLSKKTARNRELALHSLGKVLALGQESLSYISFLLFYHHALHDLHEFFRRRPLVPAGERQACAQQLLGGMLASLGQVDDRLAVLVAEDLTGSLSESPGGYFLHSPPKWADYLRVMERSAADFADEFAANVRTIIERSGEYLHDRAEAKQVPLLPRTDVSRVQSILDRLAPRAVLNEETCLRWQSLVGEFDDVWLFGPFAEADREVLSRCGQVHCRRFSEIDGSLPGTSVVLHLEADAKPLEQLAALAQRCERLIVAYTLPELFIPSLEPLAARDLASTAARSGMTIVGFDTFVGSTTLVLRRPRVPRESQPVTAGIATASA